MPPSKIYYIDNLIFNPYKIMPLNTDLSNDIASTIKNIQAHQDLVRFLKNNMDQLQHPITEEQEHQLEQLKDQLAKIKETKQEEDVLTPFETAIQDLENRKTVTPFSAFYNTFAPLYQAINKFSNLIKDNSSQHVLYNVKTQLDLRQKKKKMIKHDVLCFLLKCVQQHQETQEIMEVETLRSLAEQDIAKVEQVISKNGKNEYSIWEETLKECLSDLSNKKEKINIKGTIDVIQTKLKQLPTEEYIHTIQGVLVDIQNKIKNYFLERRAKSLKTIEASFKDISGKMQDIYRRLNEETDQSTAVESLNPQNSEEIQKSDSFAAQLEEAFTLFFEKKEWDQLGRGCLFFNKITPDGIVKIRNILKNDTNDTFNIITHEEKIFLICQIIKLKAHHSKSFSRRNDVDTQYQELDNLLSKTYHHLYPLNCLPEKSQLNTHVYNEENTRELLEYLTNTLPGQSSLPQPSRSP